MFQKNPLSMLILGQKSCILGPTNFKIPLRNWHWSYSWLQQFDRFWLNKSPPPETENVVNVLTLVWYKNSWNHFKWTYFRRMKMAKHYYRPQQFKQTRRRKPTKLWVAYRALRAGAATALPHWFSKGWNPPKISSPQVISAL